MTTEDDDAALYSDQVKFELSKLVDAAGGASFKDFKTELEGDVAVAVRGQANTAQLPPSGGSRAALEVLNLIRRDIHHADIRLAEQSAAAQLVDRDYRINVDRRARAVAIAGTDRAGRGRRGGSACAGRCARRAGGHRRRHTDRRGVRAPGLHRAPWHADDAGAVATLALTGLSGEG